VGSGAADGARLLCAGDTQRYRSVTTVGLEPSARAGPKGTPGGSSVKDTGAPPLLTMGGHATHGAVAPSDGASLKKATLARRPAGKADAVASADGLALALADVVDDFVGTPEGEGELDVLGVAVGTLEEEGTLEMLGVVVGVPVTEGAVVTDAETVELPDEVAVFEGDPEGVWDVEEVGVIVGLVDTDGAVVVVGVTVGALDAEAAGVLEPETVGPPVEVGVADGDSAVALADGEPEDDPEGRAVFEAVDDAEADALKNVADAVGEGGTYDCEAVCDAVTVWGVAVAVALVVRVAGKDGTPEIMTVSMSGPLPALVEVMASNAKDMRTTTGCPQ